MGTTLQHNLERASNWADRVGQLMCIALFAAMALSCMIQVFTRFVLNSSLSWTEEFARYTFIWLNILGASICVKHGSHAVLTFVVDRLPSATKRLVAAFADFMVLVGAWLMVTEGVKMVLVTMVQPSPAMRVPMGYIYLSVPVSGMVICIHKIRDLVATAVRL